MASSLLGVGVDYAQISNVAYTQVLFLLSRVMVSSYFSIESNIDSTNRAIFGANHKINININH